MHLFSAFCVGGHADPEKTNQFTLLHLRARTQTPQLGQHILCQISTGKRIELDQLAGADYLASMTSLARSQPCCGRTMAALLFVRDEVLPCLMRRLCTPLRLTPLPVGLQGRMMHYYLSGPRLLRIGQIVWPASRRLLAHLRLARRSLMMPYLDPLKRSLEACCLVPGFGLMCLVQLRLGASILLSRFHPGLLWILPPPDPAGSRAPYSMPLRVHRHVLPRTHPSTTLREFAALPGPQGRGALRLRGGVRTCTGVTVLRPALCPFHPFHPTRDDLLRSRAMCHASTALASASGRVPCLV